MAQDGIGWGRVIEPSREDERTMSAIRITDNTPVDVSMNETAERHTAGESRLSRRRLLQMTGLSGLSLAVSACTSPPPTPTTAPTAPPSPAAAPTAAPA